MLGITIPFFIGDKLQDYKDKKTEQKHLQRFIENIDNDIKELNRVIKLDSIQLSYSLKILNQEKSDSLVLWITKLAKYDYFEPQNITYLTLVQSGDIKLIDKHEILGGIVNLYKDYEVLSRIERNYYEHIKTHIVGFLYKNIDIQKGMFINENNKDLTNLKNVVLSQSIMIQGLLRDYIEIKKYAIKLKSEISSEIKP